MSNHAKVKASLMPIKESHSGGNQQIIVTESIIRLNRRWNYASRSRPNALAIIHPETRSVLYSGKVKIEVEEKPEEEQAEKEQSPKVAQRTTDANHFPSPGNRKLCKKASTVPYLV